MNFKNINKNHCRQKIDNGGKSLILDHETKRDKSEKKVSYVVNIENNYFQKTNKCDKNTKSGQESARSSSLVRKSTEKGNDTRRIRKVKKRESNFDDFECDEKIVDEVQKKHPPTVVQKSNQDFKLGNF